MNNNSRSELAPSMVSPEKPLEPEKRLVMALLIRSLRDIADWSTEMQCWVGVPKSFDGREAFGWFIRDDSDPFSFKWVCEILKLNADQLHTIETIISIYAAPLYSFDLHGEFGTVFVDCEEVLTDMSAEEVEEFDDWEDFFECESDFQSCLLDASFTFQTQSCEASVTW